MMRCASRSLFVPLALVLALAWLGSCRAADEPAEELPPGGHIALSDEYKSLNDTWQALVVGQDSVEPGNKQQQQAIDVAARWIVYRLTWGLEKEGKFSEILKELNENLDKLRLGREKSLKAAEMYTKQLIVHAREVLQTRKPIARINAAYVLARLADRVPVDEKPDDVLHRLAGTNQAELADALANTIGDANQIDAAKYWAFRGLHRLLSLPRSEPPALPIDKEQAALVEVQKYLEAHNKPAPPGTPDDEIDGFRYIRREAIKALAAGRYPTLSTQPDNAKLHPTLVLLKVAARDGVQPEPRLSERVEAAIGVARAQVSLDKDYQPDYAAHQLGFFVIDFMNSYDADKQAQADAKAKDQVLLPAEPWKIEASRLIEALEGMKAQAKNDHVTLVVDQCLALLNPVEKAGPTPNVADLENKLKAVAAPSKELYQGVPDSTVTFGGKPAAAPMPEDKKDK